MTDHTVRTAGRLFYDGECAFCLGWVRRMERAMGRRGFTLAPLQSRERRRLAGESSLKLETRRQDASAPGEIPHPGFPEMILALPDGRELGGADAAMEIARHIWWLWPLWLGGRIPGVMPVFRAGYRFIARHRHCAGGACVIRKQTSWLDWLPVVLLPIATWPLRDRLPNWFFMWLFVTAIFAGCKWLTWRRAQIGNRRASFARTLGYLLAWPGMDANAFLTGHHDQKPRLTEWFWAASRLLAGVALVWLAAKAAISTQPVANAWIGMFGLTLILHFGSFHLIALAWQRAGVPAKPLMQSPLRATSLAAFWGVRWNTAFNKLVNDHAFRPLARRVGVSWATLVVFAISGVIHELALSFPARGGCGLPFGYFILQGMGVLIERSPVGRALGLAHGWRGWLFMFIFTAAPAYWLFHPAFIHNVIQPMLHFIGAT
jgi:predicted DCC family thiol-disulfide oxidoreductase YuxK